MSLFELDRPGPGPVAPRATRPGRRALALAAVLALGGCPRPMMTDPHVTPQPPPPMPADRLLASRIGAGDSFEVRVYQEPDLSGIYRVGADGRIDFPFCGRITVTGRTTSDIADSLTACLREGYLKTPQVTVVARETNSKKVFVFGHVQKPGTFVYEDGMTVIQAITLAGGLAQFAKGNQTSVIRPAAEGVEQKYLVPVEDIGTGRAPNFYLQPGDIVFVPESIF